MGARLILETADGSPAFELDAARPITLGRSRENAIVLADEHASRVHARVQFVDGRWSLTDLDSRNGTQLDGEPIRGTVELTDGQEILVGDSRLRFQIDGGSTATGGPLTRVIESPHGDSTTHLKADALTALCRFMAAAVEENEPSELLRRALRAILKQTGASLAGYLGLDPADPVPKLVLPDDAKVDQHLSRQLTAKVQQAGQPVWLGANQGDNPADSLMPFTDAVGLPVKAGGEAVAAVHVYKTNARFDERDVRFCEALVGYLANGLNILRARRALEAENSRLRHRAASDDLIGNSPAMRQMRTLIARVAPQPTTVLIVGESGTGKELVATALHKQGRPAGGPLVAVNCAAIPPTMMEAELFGYRKGAFSGAERDYPGMFQQADEGTLFLDEVGDLSAESQAKLLRVIESKSFKPLGTTTEVKADVRVIAATNRDLEADVRAGRFRQDLYFRLKVVTIPVPPLRAHAEDIPAIADFFLKRLAQECRKQVTLTPAAVKKLKSYSWPGNVRQLRSALENAVVMSDCDTIDATALHLPEGEAGGGGMPLNLDALERWAICEALQRTNGNKSAAAELVGISRETLTTKLKKYEMS
ncbi:MAG TPA: sigma 54-interacting transcriptional regulator [Gemmataceae bacterium]|nr:sigma 54-interacting transcriptional regulator [Gemmataceae bacterium]